MDSETKKLLKRIIANQAVLFAMLDQIQHKLKGSSRMAGIESYYKDLKREADKMITIVDKDD